MTHAFKRKDKPETPDLPIKALKRANDSKPHKTQKPDLKDKENFCCDCATD